LAPHSESVTGLYSRRIAGLFLRESSPWCATRDGHFAALDVDLQKRRTNILQRTEPIQRDTRRVCEVVAHSRVESMRRDLGIE
jgi:hypothetical protein